MRFALLAFCAALSVTAQEPQSPPSSTPGSAPAQKVSPASPQASAPKAGEPAQTQPTPPSPVSPTQAPAPPSPAAVLRVTTRMVVVDVVVTDGSGRPVTDLKGQDFEVRENGKPQKIVGFGFQHPNPVSTGSDSHYKPPVLPPGVFTNLRDLSNVNGPPTILLVDALNTQLKDQMYLRQQLVKYLEHIEPRRNVAIYTLGRRLRLIQDFTSDPDLLHEALKKVSGQSSLFNQEPQSFEEQFPGLDTESSDQAEAQMAQELKDFEAEQEAFQRDVQVRMTLDAMNELARNVAGYPGRKNLVWLSGSFPLTIFPDQTSGRPFATVRQYADDLRKTAALFSANQIAVYPVDARGLVGTFMPDASHGGAVYARPSGGARMGRDMQQAGLALNTSHDTMNELAGQTGGRAFYNRNDIDHAIALSVTEGSTYYSLAYYPEDKDLNGKFRKIEVKLDRRGLQARYRKGYFAVDAQPPDEKTAQAEFYSALAPEAPLATALPFIVRITTPAKDQEKNKDAVIVDFSVLPTAITFQPQGGLQHAQVEFVTRAFDPKGKPAGTPHADMVSTELKPATYSDILKRGLRFRQVVNLPPGKYVLKMGVRDGLGNQIGTLVAKVEVPQAQGHLPESP